MSCIKNIQHYSHEKYMIHYDIIKYAGLTVVHSLLKQKRRKKKEDFTQHLNCRACNNKTVTSTGINFVQSSM